MNDTLKSLIPTLAAALGGPLAGMAAKFVTDKLGLPPDTPDNITAMLSGMTPEKLIPLRTADNEFKEAMAKLGYDSFEAIEKLNASVVVEVNKTMQSESASAHWPSYTWRPFIGFTFGFYVNSLWLLPLFHVTPVIMDPSMVLAIGGILGVASYFRGKAQADPTNTTMSPKG
jgi:hypothetical protein